MGGHFESCAEEKDVPHEETTSTIGREGLEGREQHKHVPSLWEAEKSTRLMSILR